MDFKKIAREILANVGNEENIKDVIHCHTRLRFSLIDSDKVNKDNLSKIEGVITVVESMDQLQVVIGSNVDKVYKELEKMLGKTTDVSNNEVLKNEKTKGNSFNKALTTMAQIFTPTIYALAGSGMIKGILAVVSMYYLNVHNIDIKQNDTYVILSAASDAVFYFFPIILGYTSAKVFKTHEIISMVLGATLCYPGIVALMAEDRVVTLFNINITKASYTSSVIPIIIAIWVLSYVERFLKKVIPDVIEMIMVPTLSILIMVPATLLVFGPIGIWEWCKLVISITYKL